MADVRIDFGFDNLDKANKLLKEMQKTAKSLRESMKKTGTVLESDASSAKKLAAATKKISSEKKKLTAVEKEELRQRRALETINAKLARASSKENRELIEKQKQLRKINTELRNGGKNTNAWGKALGSFQFKFNALGNIAANALSKITSKLAQSIKGFTSLEKIIRSNQESSDRFDRAMGRLKGSFDALNRALAKGDLSNIGSIMREAADAAEVYIRAMDTLGDTQNAINIQTAKSRLEVFKLQEVYNNTNRANEERLEAAQKASDILNTLQAQQEKVARQNYDNEYNRIQGTFRLTDEQLSLYKRFIENYNLLTDDQVSALEKLETQQDKVGEGGVDLTAQVRGSSTAFGQAAVSTNLISKETEKYNSMIAELSKTLGFDVEPIMKTIVGTNDEARKSVVDSTIAYYDQLRITQRLQNANAAMQGSILNKIDSTKGDTEATEDATDVIEDFGVSIDRVAIKGVKFADLISGSIRKDVIEPLNTELPDTLDNVGSKFDDMGNKVADSLSYTGGLVTSFSDLFAASKAKELSAVGDNAKERERIEREYAKKEQGFAIASATINGAEAVTQIWSKWAANPVIAGIFTALALGTVGAQVAIIKNQKFAEGGWVDGQPHSQGGTNIEAEKGEFVIKKRSASKYSDLIEAINQDDQVRIMDAMSRDRKIQINGSGDPFNRKIYELMRSQERYGEDNEFYIQHKGNRTLKIRKN